MTGHAPARRARRRPVPAPPADRRVLAKPPVRKLARDLGVDLRDVVPSGTDGVITRADVQRAGERSPEPDPPPRDSAPVPTPGERRIPVRGVRRAMAEAMVASAFSAPHVTEFITVDVTPTTELVERLRRDPDFAGLRVTPLLLVLKAFLVAIRRHPDINASWDDAAREIVVKDAVNLGVAVATPRGLVVPHIKDAQSKTLPQLAEELRSLVEEAREGRTAPAAMTGGTVTVTNIGVFGVDSGTPILNPGEAAILAVGAIKTRPWVCGDRVVPRQVMTLALSFDHRLVDGQLGSAVLSATAAVLERPERLMTWS
ncbi:dihydrolipoamide acetyltransferase family protein [Microbispora sitophila]|uniref:dihydrolipoamide acetyltransferase family protein n=1 Tax=Microbispora sitophila TaxID=2771537 RepID=UPI00299F8279|nr:dihydrolipoamide acetyltransferase family protein [Microbispora sitophila]